MELGRVLCLIEKIYLGSRDKIRPDVFLLLGAPGIGKTEGTHQMAKRIAEKLEKELVLFDEIDEEKYAEIIKNRDKYFVLVELRMSEVLPEDFLGIPRSEGDVLWYKQLAWVKLLRTGPGLLFIDECNIFDEPSKAAILYKTLERRVGFSKLNKDVLIVLAGNRPEDSGIARELPAPIIDRIKGVYYVDIDLEGWMNWAKENNIHPAIIEFIKQYEMLIYRPPKDSETLEKFTTPRSWAALSDILYAIEDDVRAGVISKEELTEIIAGSIGSNTAVAFVPFFMTWVSKKRMTIEDMFKRYFKTEDVSERKRYIIALLMEEKNPELAMKFIEKIAEEDPDTLYSVIFESRKNNRQVMSSSLYEYWTKNQDNYPRFTNIVSKALKELLAVLVKSS